MSKPAPSFIVNSRVSHFMYGLGTISAIDHTYTTIDFDENGRRKFVTTMVQLDPTEIAAPPPARRSRAKTAKAVKAGK